MTALRPADGDDRSTPFWNARQVNPARTLILCAIGALIGLGIAGYGLFTASGTTTAIYPAEDAAIVNGIPVLKIDLIAQIRALYDVSFDRATKLQRDRALNDLIREELYVQRGIELGMPTDDTDVRAALVGAAEAQSASEVMADLPDPAALMAFYQAHHDRYASEGVMRVSDWIVPGGRAAEASSIATKLRAGASPQTLGLTASGKLDDAEQYYFAARIHLGPALFPVAAQMSDSSVSAPIAVDGQTHILAMEKNLRPVQSPYEEVKARVVTDYIEAAKKRALADNTKFLFGRAKISIAPTLR